MIEAVEFTFKYLRNINLQICLFVDMYYVLTNKVTISMVQQETEALINLATGYSICYFINLIDLTRDHSEARKCTVSTDKLICIISVTRSVDENLRN